MENNRVHVSLLLDIYGEALSERRREVLRLYYDEDLSLSEIAENVGITRQGVRCFLVSGERCLESLEKKLGFLAKAQRINSLAREIAVEAERSGNEKLCRLSAELQAET